MTQRAGNAPDAIATGKDATARRALQVFIAVAGCLPVFAGAAGIVAGPRFLGATSPWPVDLDSHMRFLSGVFLVVGLAWWSCIPSIETKGERLRLLAAMTFAGGLARLASLGLAGAPSAGHLAGLAMELVAVPFVVLWHARGVRMGWRRPG
ncbi:DUF4345 domain-containing protein [Aquibium microcysteis]|uniref:DUF4345 domain-containing protein n=1 Tax=Aquibium microcysteis TaxID=675281 RepID=UPI00165CF809|nr:DUF4345 domain-containing protein [Aquibium microcysteis]